MTNKEKQMGASEQVDPKATERLPDPGLTRDEADVLAYEAKLEEMSPNSAHYRSALDKLRAALSAPEAERGGELTPEECRELFSLWLCHGIPPDEIDHSHPAHTGAMKLGAAQPHPEDGDPGRSLRLPRPESEQGEGQR